MVSAAGLGTTSEVPVGTTGLMLNTETGLITGTPTATGTTALTVTATDAAGSSASQNYTLSINPAATTTTLTASPTESVFGQTVTYTVTVSADSPGAGTPTGTVSISCPPPSGLTQQGRLFDESGMPGVAIATFTTNTVTLGTQAMTAVYSGDGNFTGSTSTTLMQMVNQAATATTLTASTTASVFGQTVTYTVTVSAVSPGAGTPTGTVTFMEGGTSLGTSSLSDGVAFDQSPVPSEVITLNFTAIYSGDGNFTGSTSTTLTETVNQPGTLLATTTSLISSINPSIYGHTTVFSVLVSSTIAVPTGTVSLVDGRTLVGTATLNSSGQAFFSTAALAAGNHSVTAIYAGDGTCAASTSATLTQTVSQANSTIVLSSSVNPAAIGRAVTFTGTVTGAGSVTGNITFMDGSTALGIGLLTGGQATYTSPTLAMGAQPITAIYGGDSNHTGSASTVLLQTVVPIATVSIPTTFSGQRGSTISVPVNLSQSDGLDAAELAISYDTSRLAVLSTSAIQEGTLTGSFDGFEVNLNSAAGTICVSLYRTAGPIFGLGSGSLVTIDFLIKSTAPAGPAIINLEQSIGATTTALYATDAARNPLGNFALQPAPSNAAGDSLDGKITVAALSTTSLTSALNQSSYGQAVTFTATVSGQGGTPTGTVTFQDDGSSIGTGTLTPTPVPGGEGQDGTATFTTSSLSVGDHAIQAVYGGDSNFAGGLSALLTQVVNVPTFQVISLTPTSTGFVAVFNRPLDLGTGTTPMLNLYDNSSGSLGPADVTLVGAHSGAIRGSLLVDQNNTRITFIQTDLGSTDNDGILPNDTYTVTLRSASNGFQDSNGNLLDGTDSGTPGDNYVSTFVVKNAASAVVVSLPDFARGPGQPVDMSGSGSGLPLQLTNTAATAVTVTSVCLELAYNPSLLTVTGYSGAPSGATVTMNTTSTAGVALITFTSSSGLVLRAPVQSRTSSV